MKKLFIIGNGFDCYGHSMTTKYSDFKKYLIKRFPEYDEDYDGILESRTMPDGGQAYNMDEVVGSIIRLLNNCAGDDWGILEACLGKEYAEIIREDSEWYFDEIDWENDNDRDNDNEWHSIYNNEDTADDITGAYATLRELFTDWVFDELGKTDYSKIRKLRIKPSFRSSLFLNFNYTKTLEKLYGVNRDKVCHIHGDAEDRNSEIYFGHGDEYEMPISSSYMGIEDAFDSLIKYLKKDTDKAIADNLDFFKGLKDVKKIYSYGFSFSEVDMVYLEEIAKVVDPAKTKWYFNRFDWKNNKEYIEKVNKLGFKVCRTYKW